MSYYRHLRHVRGGDNRLLQTMISLLLLASFCVSAGDKLERKLYDDLLTNRQPLERPIENSSLPITVRLGMILQQLISVDEKNQILTMNAWLNYTWTDYNLRWKPAEYGGLSRVVLPIHRVWKPDVLLYNSVDSDFDSTFPVNMAVYSDGTITWSPPAIFQISCKMDITFYPFDEQHCYLKFGAWSYDGTLVDIESDGMDMSEYLPNGEWIIKNTSVVRSVVFYDCCNEPYPDVRFYITMRRRTLYYYFNLVLPCTLITMMCIVGFTLPPQAGEKTTLQMTVMLAIGFFLKIVTDMTPRTSEALPLLGVFFSSCLMLVSASIVLTVLVLNMHHKAPESCEMSIMTRKLMLHWLPWMLRMRRQGQSFRWRNLPPFFEQNSLRNKKSSASSVLLAVSGRSSVKQHCVIDMDGQDKRVPNATNNDVWQFRSLKGENRENPQQQHTEIAALVQEILSEMKTMTKRMSRADTLRLRENEWKFAATVADRLCLLLLTLAIVVTVLIILFRAPYLYA